MTDKQDHDYDPEAAELRQIPDWAGNGHVYDERWLVDKGIGEDGDAGCSVTDLSPGGEHSEAQFVFKYNPEMAVLALVTLHRHGMEGECEQAPADQYTEDAEVPDEALAIAAHELNAPVAVPGRERAD